MELTHHRIVGLRQDTHQVGMVQTIDVRDDRKTTHELRNQTKLTQVLCREVIEDIALDTLLLAGIGIESNSMLVRCHTTADDLLDTRKSTR